MGNINSRSTIKWWDLHTKTLKYCSSDKFDEHNNKFGKLWSPSSTLMNGTSFFALPTIKMYLSYHPFIKDDIFESTVKFPPRGTTIGIVDQYCEHHNMYYVSKSNNNRQWNQNLPTGNRNNACIIIIGKKSNKSKTSHRIHLR